MVMEKSVKSQEISYLTKRVGTLGLAGDLI